MQTHIVDCEKRSEIPQVLESGTAPSCHGSADPKHLKRHSVKNSRQLMDVMSLVGNSWGDIFRNDVLAEGTATLQSTSAPRLSRAP